MHASRFVLGAVVSGGLHLAAFAHMSHARAGARSLAAPVVLEVDTADPPTTRDEPPPAPAADPDPAPSVPARSERPAPVATAVHSPASQAAQAGQVMAGGDDAVADFTMVQGTAAAFVGGTTSSSGRSRTPALGPAPAAYAAPAGSAGGAGSPGPDRSAPARPVGGDWDCTASFPAGATVDTATVVIVARVRADGTPESVSVVSDPGQGFGPAARACAMRQKYGPGADKEGRPVLATTAPFRVRFTR